MAPNENQKWPQPAAQGAPRSVLSNDLVIEGDITSLGPVDIHGKVQGSVRAPNIVIVADGVVEGSVTAIDLTIAGTLTGEAEAESANLAPQSSVTADITHSKIAIESGARFEGRLLRRKTPPPSAPPVQPAP
ncbi:MAG: polymer-forming cytoskeletal protein [Tabrizicola sp.]|uniref:bactofilin family protein n=1 Tax=Tabrizicola sp. TaxID=2005166 RepID=UPI00273438B2|nr:polymer-forming cytoskeletal protein [Tabrizicola sp.]MDP3261632.1 polymer-forming cytoskeletal protein [Tabrizicola sp.]MDP3648298.1 polymer-forming cytoskeletal protein [Paracoccaceae bacterium]MDZ4065591.1 polymer-forming cytoskeletal protein [Tabrizicola sp.]